jgi:hypothetical protein
MKSLIKNYIELLSIDKLKEFSLKNNINLTDIELNYLLNLVKNNYENILKDDTKYLEAVKNNINPTEFLKIKELYLYYKNRYKGYLF